MIKKRRHVFVVPGVWAAVVALIACGSTLALASPDSESSLIGVGESLGQDHSAERTSYQTTTAATDLDTLLYQDWEGGIGNWWVDNGVWEVGVATVGPDSAHSGQKCAATVLGGNYPVEANTRLISPQIDLSSLADGETVTLKFWHWFRIAESVHGDDRGRIQISVDGGVWRTIHGPISGWSPVWSQACVDLSAYADSTVSIAFYFTSNWTAEDNGWYVDDIAIVDGPVVFNNPEGFELGAGDWSADNGLWEVGVPTAGPDTAHTGDNCVATVLGGNYPVEANTRLISPEILLIPAPGEIPMLYFWHWFRIAESVHGDDQGHIQVSVDGGVWRTIHGPISGWSPAWSQMGVNLSAYADSTVSIAFYFTSNWTAEDNGWYIDDVRIDGIIPPTGVDDPEPVHDAASPVVLHQNAPNPFRPTTTISYQVDIPGWVSIDVYNSAGQHVENLVDRYYERGLYHVDWNSSGVSSGVYLYRVVCGDWCDTRKCVVLK